MKKILLCSLAVVLFASCAKDITSVNPTGQLSKESSDEVAAKDPDKVLLASEAALYTRFATYFPENQHVQSGQKGFDMIMGMGGNDLVFLMPHSMHWYDYILGYWEEGYVRASFFWGLYYETIANANEILLTATKDAISSTDSDALRGYRARALTFRAFSYFHLINVYQYPYNEQTKDQLMGVPISTEENMGVYQGRGTIGQVYEKIIEDLEEAILLYDAISYNDLASRTDIDGSVAKMIRARVAMIKGEWQYAADLADDILGKYTLLAKEDIHNGFNRIEAISSLMWGFKMSTENSMSWASFSSQFCPYMDGYAGDWAERPIWSYLYNSMPITDVRRGWWVNATDNPNPNYDPGTSTYACVLPNIPGVPQVGVNKPRSEYVSVKFFTNNSFAETDLMFMRAEEAVFIKAEAQAHLNLTNARTTLTNWVTTYRDPAYTMTATSMDDVITEIIRQKRIEMWMEGGLEYLDLRRLNLPVDRSDRADMTALGVVNNHTNKLVRQQNVRGMRYQLPRNAVIANTEIGEANQND